MTDAVDPRLWNWQIRSTQFLRDLRSVGKNLVQAACFVWARAVANRIENEKMVVKRNDEFSSTWKV